MSLVIPIITLWAIAIIVLAFFNLRYSITLYIAYLILVPFMKFNVAGISILYNTVNTILILSFLFYSLIKKKYKFEFVAIKPFLILFLLLFISTLFGSTVPLLNQLDSLRGVLMTTCIVPFIIWNISRTDKRIITNIKWAFIISITIAGIYGVFLIFLGGINPYTSYLSLVFDIFDAADIYMDSESRLGFSSAAKIQSTTLHPMTWALYLCLLLVVLVAIYFKEKKKWLILIICLIGFNILISGVRTGIAAIAIGTAYYMIVNRQVKIIAIGTLGVIILFIIIISIPDLQNLFSSFIDVGGKSSVEGSSIAMRLRQFNGCLNEINGCEIFGKGFGWSTEYNQLHGDHPVILAFESLLFIVICNSGFWGIFSWIIFFLLLYNNNKKILNNKDHKYIINTLTIIYIAYTIGTGDYGYLQIFSLYYTFLLIYLLDSEKQLEIYEKS